MDTIREITGRTRIMFILGDPVAHIRGSAILTNRMNEAGKNVAVSPLHALRERDSVARPVANIREQDLGNSGIASSRRVRMDPAEERSQICTDRNEVDVFNERRSSPLVWQTRAGHSIGAQTAARSVAIVGDVVVKRHARNDVWSSRDRVARARVHGQLRANHR